MKNSEKKSGFTLVEAIVVAVLASVLAVTAVMLYRGFITETKAQTVVNLAEAGAAAANAFMRKTGENLAETDVDRLHLYYDSSKYNVVIDPANRKIIVTDLKEPTIIGSAEY